MQVQANGITLEVEQTGTPDGLPVLLICGQSEQLIDWPDSLIGLLTDAGYRVVVFDNRDVGLSERCPTPYSLDDMAADTLGVLDALGIERTCVIGSSLGGVIAQILALKHPERVAAQVLLMTAALSTMPDVEAELALADVDAERFVKDRLAYNDRFGGSIFRQTRDEAIAKARRQYQRNFDPEGANRQLSAAHSAAAADTTPRSDTPTLVIHGDEDAIIPLGTGKCIVRTFRNSSLLTIAGMGHTLSDSLINRFGTRVLTFLCETVCPSE